MYFYFSSLTASKEAGAFIEIDGKKSPLVFQARNAPSLLRKHTNNIFSFLRGEAVLQNAAIYVLLYVSYHNFCY